MDAEIEDIKRRAGLLSEQEDVSSLETMIRHIDGEHKFLISLGQALDGAVAPDRSRQFLAIIRRRITVLRDINRKLQSQSQKQRQGRQEKAFQSAEQAKAGGPRRPQ